MLDWILLYNENIYTLVDYSECLIFLIDFVYLFK
jgi:hypothetical protein